MAITRKKFREEAKSIVLQLNGQPVMLEPKDFSTGSIGWYAGGKVVLEVGGEPLKCQIGFNITVVGSKELPKDPSAPVVEPETKE